MSLQKSICRHLDDCIETGQVKPLKVSVEEGSLQCRLSTVESLACSFESVTWHSLSPNKDGQAVLARADRLGQQLSYLLETVAPLEFDEEQGLVQMRSDDPEQGGSGCRYYELLVSREGAHLCRYEKQPGEARAAVPITVTREVFERLAIDLAEAG